MKWRVCAAANWAATGCKKDNIFAVLVVPEKAVLILPYVLLFAPFAKFAF